MTSVIISVLKDELKRLKRMEAAYEKSDNRKYEKEIEDINKEIKFIEEALKIKIQ